MPYQYFIRHKLRTSVGLIVTILVFYTLSLHAEFIDIGASIPAYGQVGWVDFDNDGDLDLWNGGPIYQNDNGLFVNTGISIYGDVWFDYDKDGDADLEGLSGVYRNDGNHFTYYPHNLLSVINEQEWMFDSGDWGDLDNDGDLDYIANFTRQITAEFAAGELRVFQNNDNNFSFVSTNSCIDAFTKIKTVDSNLDGFLEIFWTGYWQDYIDNYYPELLFHNFVSSADNFELALYPASVQYADYNNDGQLELMISGYHEIWVYDQSLYPAPSMYISDSHWQTNIPGINEAAQYDVGNRIQLGDIDNDGDLDLFYDNSLYTNDNGNFTFLRSFGNPGSVALGDYDNDGDLDLAVEGTIYRNDVLTANLHPSPPQVNSQVAGNTIRVNCSGSLDDHTPSQGLSYNIRVGSTPGGQDIVSPMSNTVSGFRSIPDRGTNLALQIKPGDTIYVAAQAIDTSYKGSVFGDEIQYSSPSIQVLYPNGGEALTCGSTSQINWHQNTIGNVQIYISLDNGQNWEYISTVAAQSGTCEYTVPYQHSNLCKVKLVWENDVSYFDESDAVFTTQTPPVQITSPNGGETLICSSTSTVTWAANPYGSYGIQLTPDDGATWVNITTSPVPCSQGTYAFTVPILSSTQCRMKILWTLDNETYDLSDEVFTIQRPPIQLLYPNGGEVLVSGTTACIRWADNPYGSYQIKLTPDNGSNWIDIATILCSQGLYYYNVPTMNSTNCKIKILWTLDNITYDLSDAVFTITASSTYPRTIVTFPNATGINVTPGQPINITWTYQNTTSISIDYSTDNGLNWELIIENLNVTPASYSWTIPDVITNQARIRIRKADNANYYDISDNTFTICKVTVLSPNGGEVLTGDYSGVATVPITWSAPYVGIVNLFYSTNNGSNWTSIASVAGSSGTYNWVLPAVESSICRVKVSHSSASFISDISNAVFTIRVPAKFINANGGGFVNNNCNYTLRWKNIYIAPSSQVHLEYSTDNSNWIRINASAVPVTTLHFTFFMALGTAPQVWFRMAETGTNKIIAKSATSMTVTGKTMHISAPAVGEGLAVDSYTTITWTADGCTNFNIDYTTDFGTTWVQIGTNVPSTQGYFVWLVPNTTSTQCRIRLRDTNYTYMNIESDGEFTILAITLIASFYGTPTTGVSDLVVQFHDQSIGYISAWAWDFDNNGATDSNEQNPTWTYRQTGFYSVKLTVWDGPTSVTMTRTNYIYVQPMVADFVASESNGFAPFTIQFTDLTPSDITQWAWDFNNDGTFDADYQNPYWTYLFPGAYTVKQHVTNGFDSDDEVKTDYITVTLDPSLTLYVPTQYSTIQAAINASVDGDYIIISDGIYYENLLIEGKNITLASNYFIDGDSTHIANTIIDGSNALNPDQASTITILPASGRPVTKPHIVGFTIRNGSGRRIIQNEGGSIIEKRVGGGIYMRQVNPIFSYNKIEDNDADDEGGGSYAFQSLPNHGGMVDPVIGVYNPGGNFFANNHADIGSDIYIEGITRRDLINLQNCSFEVMSQDDTTVSNYWVNSSAGVNYTGSSGRQAAISSDIWVATNGSDTLNDGLSPASPFRTIDHALSMIYATETDPLTINIASGTYSPSLTGEKYPLQMVKHVSLLGSGQEETILDAEGNADYPSRLLNLDKVEGIQISDLTLMNGFVTLAKNYNGGAVGILSSQASLNNLIVAGCSSAGNGAGLYALDSSVDADSLSFQYNSALGSGGAIHSEQCNLNLSNSDILDNSVTKNGAGLSINGGEISISGCDISNNQATGFQSKGGGIILSGTQDALLNGNRISHNNADNGAGAYLQDNSGLRLDRNRFTNNLADYSGGGVFVNTTGGLFTNNLIANNTATQKGGALYCYSAPQFINNTIANNKAGIQGGALYLNSASPSLTNCILWGNLHANPETPNQICLYGEASDPDITFSDIQGGSTGFLIGPDASYSGVYANNLDSDPLFMEASIGAGYYFEVGQNGYSLLDESPAIDSGDPITEIQLFPLDLEANPRLDNSRIDIGAWEAVHFIGARIVANPAVLDFGRVNLSGAAIQQTICLSNTGNQPLLISALTFELPGSEFFWTFAELGTPIQPGTSVNLQISFMPDQLGAVSNILSLVNNSLNSPLLRIPLSGYGIDASTSQPGNVQLQIIGNDVHLSWNPVMSDPQGNPFTPEGYIVLYCETANATLDDFLFLTFCTGTTAIHNSVARFRDRMFYRVIAIDGMTRSSLEAMLNRYNPDIPLSWAEIRKSLKKN